MFGCMFRIGCGILLLILGALGWHFRDKWVPKVKALVTAEAPATTAGWTPITVAGGTRATERIESLGRRNGPAYVTLTATEFASYVLGSALSAVAAGDTSTQAIVQDGMLYIRTRVRLADLGGKDALGPLARMFNDTEPVMVAGTLSAVRPGLAQFRLKEVAVRDLKVPRSAVGTLVKRWGPTPRPEGLATDGLPVTLPADVVDLRVADGKITLYKKTG